MPMQPRTQADVQWDAAQYNRMSPEAQHRQALQNALRHAEQTGDYTAYRKMVWDRMSPERKKQQMFKADAAQYRRAKMGQ